MSQTLYTAKQTRELDRIAIEEAGIPGFELMRRAGEAALAGLLDCWPGVKSITVCCGKGNNAGDGYLVAGRAVGFGIEVELLQLEDLAALRGDAATARDWAVGQGVQIRACAEQMSVPRGEVIVDALLGTGLTGAPRGLYAAAIETINQSGKAVLAVDIPSGVSADTGAIAGVAIHADLTVTFIGRKLGLYTGAGAAAAGEVVFADLGVGADITGRVQGVPLLKLDDLLDQPGLPERSANAYKHALGHVLVVGGDDAMGGAPLMAAEAALRVGAGMVTVATRAHHRSAILARRPELMVVDADDDDQLLPALQRATTLVVGPGLGRGRWGLKLLEHAIAAQKVMVVDADGLNLIAEADLRLLAPAVFTPHAGEAATLLSRSVAEVQADRPGAGLALAELAAGAAGVGVSVLKGAGTVISHSSGPTQTRLLGVCGHGNPGMASAGMGDVLSGVIGGLLAQGMTAADAALIGVIAHSKAADDAVRVTGERGLLATDLLPELMRLLA
jgi:hydroxyethylthiazole kinase-like uncharacterized protein yjeF